MNMKIRNMMFCALCIALGLVLPMMFHAIPNAGSILLPMHIPVLLCGLLCGPVFGLLCGILTPALSSLMTGMPPVFILPSMICELAVYGLIAGLMKQYIHMKSALVSAYVQLIIAMLAGRIVYGIMNALIFSAGSYSMDIFITAAFVTALPGILIQLLFVPGMAVLLDKVGTAAYPQNLQKQE